LGCLKSASVFLLDASQSADSVPYHADLHSITDIMAVAADVMDMDKAECSISRILPVRHPRCRENNNYAFE
jgi:hypothetical protein